MASTDDIGLCQALHVGKLLRCFLCLLPLPTPAPLPLYLEWQGTLVAVSSITDQDGNIRQLLRSTHVGQEVFRPSDECKPRWAMDTHGARLLIKPCSGDISLCGDYCPQCRPDRMIYFSHRDCWKVARVSSSSQVVGLTWSRLAVQTRPFEISSLANTRRCFEPFLRGNNPDMPILNLVPADSSLFHANTPLAKLLSKICTLAPELQLQIMGFLKDTMFSSLLLTKIFVSEMLPRLGPQSGWTMQPKTIPLHLGAELDKSSGIILSSRSVNIRGRSYLHSLTLGPLENSMSYIHIANKTIRGLQFSLGRFGLRGVRILYEDKTCSLWLGDSSFSWIGIVYCCDLSKLNIIADELRIIRLEVQAGALSQFKNQVMWYGDCPPFGSSTRLIIPKIPREVLHYYPNWIQCHYLPLSLGTDYASGLTLYFDCAWDIVGIVSHGSSDFAFGETDVEIKEEERRMPVYIPLSPGEYFTSAWRHITLMYDYWEYNSNYIHTLIALTTNLGRIHYCGPYSFLDQVDLINIPIDSEWVRIGTEQPSKILGLVFSIPHSALRGCCIAANLGVSQTTSYPPDDNQVLKPPPLPIQAKGPTLPSPSFLTYLYRAKHTCTFSAASLDNIATLHVRKKKIRISYLEPVVRCCGLRIVHLDKTIETIGQWDPRDTESISKIYDASEGLLMRLTFHMENADRLRYVENITVEVADNPRDYQPLDGTSLVLIDPPTRRWGKPGDERCYVPEIQSNTRTFDCTQSGQRIAWWFTPDFDDIGRDYGCQTIQVREHSGLRDEDELEIVQLG